MEYKEILPYYRNLQKGILIDTSYKDSIGRSYYTMFTAVRALFAMAGQNFPKHSGVNLIQKTAPLMKSVDFVVGRMV